MLTLIKREMRDHVVYLVAAIGVSGAAGGALISLAYVEVGFQIAAWILLNLVACVVVLGLACLGVAQMYSDRANKITSFLSTLAITRAQILAARCLVGLLAILLALTPILVTAVVLLYQAYPPLFFYRQVIVEVVVSVFLLAINCYCVGLLVGWTTGKALPVAGCLLYPPVIVSLVVAKGFGPEAIAILSVLALAALICTWVKYSSTPL